LPQGALFRKGSEGRIREDLLKQDLLEAVIGLGANIFYGTQIAACVMIFKQNKSSEKKGKVLFIDGSDQVRVGRAQNFLEAEHVKQLFDWYTNFKEVENFAKVVTLKDIAENEFNLNIPLYVEKVIEDNLPSVDVALKDLKFAWEESLETEEKFKKILNQFIK
jgi:type I restriction enzyme M protein